jgi:hypothetical protein
MLFEELFSHEVADTCTEKCTYHFDDTAAEQKSERTAGESRSKTEVPRFVVRRELFEFIENTVKLFNGVFT